jgi:hypothetical protein
MAATAVSTGPSTVPAKITESVFIGLARDYSANRKLVDALTAFDNPDDAFERAVGIIGRLQHMVSEGSDYTPAAALGFGSSNASTIASGILGEGLTGAQLRKRFADVGKPKK